MWLIGAMVCLLASPWVQLSVSAGSGWPHNALLHHWLMPISCHFRGCKALLVTSLTHVSGAIASVQTFTFTFTSGKRDGSSPPTVERRLHRCGSKCANTQSTHTSGMDGYTALSVSESCATTLTAAASVIRALKAYREMPGTLQSKMLRYCN